ncbi:hypothetical protein [Schaalia vaccimaxillae]|uniref:hypothetical protein n=1 Tax=Schaalia vaccimaxillae TaxID=183916 RepID=UPI0003B3AE73|nr:hypothetical protein [Schaalia vaccimaxillae]
MSAKQSWLAILITVVITAIYQALLLHSDTFATAINDEKGLSGFFVFAPLATFVCCLAESSRKGFGFWRAVACAISVLVVETLMLQILDLATSLIFLTAYILIGLVGELIGWGLRTLTVANHNQTA